MMKRRENLRTKINELIRNFKREKNNYNQENLIFKDYKVELVKYWIRSKAY